MEYAGCHHADAIFGAQDAVDHPHQHHDTDIIIEPGVDHQRLQGRIRAAFGGRYPGDHRLENLVDPQTGLGAGGDGVGRVQSDHVLDFLSGPVGIRLRQIHLVQDRNDLHPKIERGVTIGNRLSLHPLRGVDHEQRPLAGRQRTAHLIRKIDMPWGVDQIERINLTIPSLVAQGGRLGLDRNAALFFKIHRIEDLLLHFPVTQTAAALNQPIGKRGLAVINVGDDGEVANPLHGIRPVGAERSGRRPIEHSS